MAQWIFLNELEKARSLYLDAYSEKNGCKAPKIEAELWDDLQWLDRETVCLVSTSTVSF